MRMNHYGLIMAGGGGTRFWPLSRQKKPKQLLNLTGSNIMINEAVERMAEVIGKSNIFIITGEKLAADMLTATAGRVFPRNIISEPEARNTTTCIGYAAMEILRKYGDGVMVVTPADHYIENVSALTKVLQRAILTAEEQQKLITIGITPSFPSTAFGYINYDTKAEEDIKPVLGFKEKPDEATAAEYILSGSYLWNSGIFVWTASLILEKIREYAPDIYADLEKIGDAMNTPAEQDVLYKVYPGIRKLSIDYAVMEPSASKGDVVVLPCDCGWNDVGSWDMMSVLHKRDVHGNVSVGDVTAIDVKDSVIYSTCRTVTALGVENMVIVETPEAVMICPKSRAQEVKRIVDTLAAAGKNELL